MITTSISEMRKLFGDYVKSIVPNRHVQYIMRGDYPKLNKPCVFISYETETNGNADAEYDFDAETESTITNKIMTFTVDVVGGESGVDADNLANLIWNSESWKTVFAKAGLGTITPPRDLSSVEFGNVRQRQQFKMSFHCKFINILSVATFDSLQAKICEVDHVGDDDIINIDTRNLPRCQKTAK